MQDITAKILVLKLKHVTGLVRLGKMLINEIVTPDIDLSGIAKDIKGTQSHSEIVDIVEKHFPMAEVRIERVRPI